MLTAWCVDSSLRLSCHVELDVPACSVQSHTVRHGRGQHRGSCDRGIPSIRHRPFQRAFRLDRRVFRHAHIWSVPAVLARRAFRTLSLSALDLNVSCPHCCESTPHGPCGFECKCRTYSSNKKVVPARGSCLNTSQRCHRAFDVSHLWTYTCSGSVLLFRCFTF